MFFFESSSLNILDIKLLLDVRFSNTQVAFLSWLVCFAVHKTIVPLVNFSLLPLLLESYLQIQHLDQCQRAYCLCYVFF